MIRFVIGVMLGTSLLIVPAAPQELTTVELSTIEIADSQSYFVYSYRLANGATASAGLLKVQLDISASAGTPDNLPATGQLWDPTAIAGASIEPHAEVGPITPSGWEAALTGEAELWWYAPSTTRFSTDSIAAGDTLDGFGIRSSYLPGISAFEAHPTVESCCLVADTIEGEAIYPLAAAHAVDGWAIAPRYMPEEITLDVLQSQAATVCSDPLWIDDSPTCSAVADSLERVADFLDVYNYPGARVVIAKTQAILDAEREPSGAIEDDAYWLLDTNLTQLEENLPDLDFSHIYLCAGGPANTTVSFNIEVTAGVKTITPPHEIEAEEMGVDPLGSSCEEVWRLGINHAATARSPRAP